MAKSTFLAIWKVSARERSDAPPAARPGITMPYHENHWGINSFRMSRQMECSAFRCVPLPRMRTLMVLGNPWKTTGKARFLHVWQKHFQRERMGCPVRCPEKLEWSLQGRRRKSVNPSATMSGNDVRNSGRSARPRPPPTPLSLQIAIPK